MLSKKAISVDIGTNNIKIIEGKYDGNEVKVSKMITIDTPKDSFNDGEIINLEEMKKYFAESLKENNIKAKKIIFTSKSNSIITRIIEVPWVKGKELESLIKYEIEQYLPIDFNEHITRYTILQEFTKDEAKMVRVNVAVYPKDMAKGYWDLAKELRLIPEVLDLSSNAIVKLFTSRPNIQVNSKDYIKDSTIAVIDLGYNQIELSIISRGIQEFTRILMSGARYLEMEENEDADTCNKHILDRWNTDILRMLEYFRNKFKDRTISKIYVYGGASKLPDISEYMQKALGIPVERILQLSNIKLEADAVDIEIDDYLNVIGALIRIK